MEYAAVRVLGDEVQFERESFPAQAKTRVLEGLEKLLRDAATRARAQPRDPSDTWVGRLQIHADAGAPVGSVLDVVVTAYRAGYSEFSLAVEPRGGGATTRVPMSVPRQWRGDVVKDPDDPLRAMVGPRWVAPAIALIDDTGIEIQVPAQRPAQTKAPPPTKWSSASMPLDFDRLESWAKQAAARRNETAVEVRPADDLTVQAFVSALDSLRGRDCRLQASHQGAPIPDNCYLWQPIVDAQPPIPPALVER